jgi:ATP sulfurylase
MPSVPHGGRLVGRQLEESLEEARGDAASLQAVTLDEREVCDLEMIGSGAMSPLEGFMGREEYEGVLGEMRLPQGPLWSLPVTLSAKSGETVPEPGDEVALRSPWGVTCGTMSVTEVFRADLRREASTVLLTEDPSHPGVAYLSGLTGTFIAGPVRSFRDRASESFPGYRLDPRETRVLFRSLGWDSVTAFQTRNPVHRAHEYIQKCALEVTDGLLLHPLVGRTKDDDIPAEVRMRCYEVLLEGYFPRGRVAMSVLPAAMRYAGPREAVFHAIVRKNYGCSHFIVGRDHAGVGSFYGTYDAQLMMLGLPQHELGIVPLCFEHAFYCRICDGMATSKTCPHGDADHIVLSGRRVREMLAAGETPPGEFTRPEIARLLTAWASAGRE